MNIRHQFVGPTDVPASGAASGEAVTAPGGVESRRRQKTALSAVVCPLTARELPAALANLRFWDSRMPPLIEASRGGGARAKLIYSFNGEPDEDLSRSLFEEFDRCEVVKRSFESIDVRFCRLPPEKDVYLRDGETGDAPFGRKAGPNWLFFETMRALREDATFVFLMETDCQPLTPNWIHRIERACILNQDAWIVGSHYCGASPLHWSIARHINGNALYNIGDTLFWEFLEERFWPWLNDYAVKSMPDLAYDCGWETYLNRMEMEDAGSYEWIRVRDIMHRFRLSNFVVNIGGVAEQSGEYIWTRDDILKRFPNATIVHGPLAPSLDHRRGPLAVGRPHLKGSATIDDRGLTAERELGKTVFRRSLWIIGHPLEEADTIKTYLMLHSVKNANVTVTLREPGGRLIGSKKISGAGFDKAQAASFVQELPRAMPYVRLVLHFHGPADARVRVSDLRCEVRRNGEVLWRTNRVLSH